MGLSEQISALEGYSQTAPGSAVRSKSRKKHWLLKIPGSRRVFLAIYKRLFNILYS